jgi:hypothetical protein
MQTIAALERTGGRAKKKRENGPKGRFSQFSYYDVTTVFMACASDYTE